MNTDLKNDLRFSIVSGMGMKEIREKLVINKEAGLTKDAALAILESLRADAPNEAFEDRVLEVMDFVAGFCAKEWRIWED